MDIPKLTSSLNGPERSEGIHASALKPTFHDPTAPKREINLSETDELTVQDALASLGRASSKTEKLFDVFAEWQSRRTYTMRRVLITSILVILVSAWVGVDYKEISILGLQVSNGNMQHFLIFLIAAVLASAVVYAASIGIDLTVRKAKIGYVSSEMKSLKACVATIDDILHRNEVDSFSDLYFDFVSALQNPGRHDAIDAYRAVKFYSERLSSPAWWRKCLVIAEQVLISFGTVGALVVLAVSLYRLGN